MGCHKSTNGTTIKTEVLKFGKVLLVLTLEKVLTDYSATTNGTNRI